MGVDGEDVKQTKRVVGNAMPGRMGGSGAGVPSRKYHCHNIKDVIELAIAFF